MALIDPKLVAPCVPGCTSVEEISPTCYRAAIRIEIGPIKALFNVVVELTELQAFEQIRVVTRGEEGSKASILTAESVIRLSPIGDAVTEVRYASDVTIAGRLGKFGFGIVQKKANSLGHEFAAAFCDRVSDGTITTISV